jgi:hypothetical protein
MAAEPAEYIKDWPKADPREMVIHRDKQTGQKHYFYPHESLVKAHYEPEEFGLVRIGDRLYELQGHIGRASERPQGGYWWVDEIIAP